MPAFVVQFPDGDREFLYPAEPPKEGDVLWHDGERYRILAITEHENNRDLRLTVEPVPDDLGDVLQSEQGGLVLVPVD
jgi:hypothetical protein